MICNICAKKCNAKRTKNKACGNCGMPQTIKIAHYELFLNEEPCISLNKGSGTIFFSGCNLKCVFCQNYDISTLNKGKYISINELVDIFKELENLGAENINLVSPTHYAILLSKYLKSGKKTSTYLETYSIVSKFSYAFVLYITGTLGLYNFNASTISIA